MARQWLPGCSKSGTERHGYSIWLYFRQGCVTILRQICNDLFLRLLAVSLCHFQMRRISIDTLGFMSPRNSATFELAKRRPWYHSRSRSLTTCLFFAALWVWFNLGADRVVIPKDSFQYLKDESLKDILNTTLGVRSFDQRAFPCFQSGPRSISNNSWSPFSLVMQHTDRTQVSKDSRS